MLYLVSGAAIISTYPSGSCALPGTLGFESVRFTASLARTLSPVPPSFRDRSARSRVVVVSRQGGARLDGTWRCRALSTASLSIRAAHGLAPFAVGVERGSLSVRLSLACKHIIGEGARTCNPSCE